MEENTVKSQYKDSLFVIRNFPLWLQQALFVDFTNGINLEVSNSFLKDFNKKEDIFAMYIPELSYKGEAERTDKTEKLPQSVYTFLDDVSLGLTITEISIKNNLPLNAVASLFLNCMEKELLVFCKYEKVMNMANYLAGKIITAEFLCKIGKISRMDLNEALNYQARIQQKTGEKVDCLNILVAKKYISKEYVKSVLKYFVDSKKRIKDLNTNVISGNIDLDTETLKITNEKLQKENKIIKEQLKKILHIQS